MSTNFPRPTGAQGVMILVLAGTVAALMLEAARGPHPSPLRGLLSNPVPRLAPGSPGVAATRRPLRRAA